MRARKDQSGQATVEFVALLPVIAVLAAALIQAVIAGQAIWLSQSAARAAARADAIGADATSAARGALPERLEGGLLVRRSDTGTVEVRIAVPALTGGVLTTVTGSARMTAQR